jgi:hypothetical protein
MPRNNFVVRHGDKASDHSDAIEFPDMGAADGSCRRGPQASFQPSRDSRASRVRLSSVVLIAINRRDAYTILVTGAQTSGRYCLIDMLVPPGGGPPPHRHDFEEMFTSWRAKSSWARLLCMCMPSGQEEFFMAIGDPVDSRTAPPPKLSTAEQAERIQRAKALSARYRTELLV